MPVCRCKGLSARCQSVAMTIVHRGAASAHASRTASHRSRGSSVGSERRISKRGDGSSTAPRFVLGQERPADASTKRKLAVLVQDRGKKGAIMMSLRPMLTVFVVTVLALLWALPALSQPSGAEPEWMAALRGGGHVIVLRHGATNTTQT